MGLKLRKRTIPQVVVERRDLPVELADGKECWIKIEARAAGPINGPYQAAIEEIGLLRHLMAQQIDDDATPKERAKADIEARKVGVDEMWRAFAEHCLISWESNIIDEDTGKVIEATPENFVLVITTPDKTLRELSNETLLAAMKAGAEIEKADEEAEKN